MEVAVAAFGPEAVRWRNEDPAAFVEMCVTALRGHRDLRVESLNRAQRQSLGRAMMAALADSPAEKLESLLYLVNNPTEVFEMELCRMLAERLHCDPLALGAFARALIAAGKLDEAATVLWRAVHHEEARRSSSSSGFCS